MFTGIIEAIGTVTEMRPAGNAIRLRVAAPGLFADAPAVLGESVAVNGVCLTVSEIDARAVRFDVVPETIRRSKLNALRAGDPVNLERAMRPTGRFGGHFVQGHVDGVGTVRSVQRAGESYLLTVQAPAEVLEFVVEKGSITIDGVSLTIAHLSSDAFSVALVPHTLSATTLGRLKVGDVVNLEADLIGKYVAQMVARHTGAAPRSDAGLLRLLQEEGYQ